MRTLSVEIGLCFHRAAEACCLPLERPSAPVQAAVLGWSILGQDEALLVKSLLALSTLAVFMFIPAAQAGNTSSNSSSNSSNGVHIRVDTVIVDDHRGRTIYERRVVRERRRSDDPSERQLPKAENNDD